jgi:hypothetical protein
VCECDLGSIDKGGEYQRYKFHKWDSLHLFLFSLCTNIGTHDRWHLLCTLHKFVHIKQVRESFFKPLDERGTLILIIVCPHCISLTLENEKECCFCWVWSLIFIINNNPSSLQLNIIINKHKSIFFKLNLFSILFIMN